MPWRERNCTRFETATKGGFEPGLSRSQVRHSTVELPRSTRCRGSHEGVGIDTKVTSSHYLLQIAVKVEIDVQLYGNIEKAIKVCERQPSLKTNDINLY